MPKGRFDSIEAAERHKLGSMRGGLAKTPKGFAVTGKAASAGRKSGRIRRAAAKEISILGRCEAEKAS